jgi:uncharacterized protein (TIGR00661 family)
LTQAIATRDLLVREGHEVTEVLVGKRSSVALPLFFLERIGTPVSTFASVYFLFSPGSKRAHFFRTILHHASRLPAYFKSVLFIKRRVEANKPDVVINFYEVLAGVTYALFRLKVPCVCMAHQYLFLHPDFLLPPRASRLELRALLFFTRLTCLRAVRLLALSFREMPAAGRMRVIPPRVRGEVKQQVRDSGDFILGYLLDAGFAGQVIEWHERHPGIPLRFFWNKEGAPRVTRVDDHLMFHQLDATAFLEQMAACKGYASTGGFESICEAMYLQKPVMMVPAHVEQECNAFDAMNVGAGIASATFDLSTLIDYIPSYVGNPGFVAWVDRADEMFTRELEAVTGECCPAGRSN